MTRPEIPHRPLCVGVTAAGGGIAQTVIDGLRACPFPVRIVGFELTARAKGLYDCDAAYRLPPATDPSYCERIMAVCRDEGIDLLIPGSDPELPVLAAISHRLKDIGCTVLSSPEACVRTLQDKKALHDAMVKHDVPFYRTVLVSEAIERPDAVTYPAIVKPRWGSASTGIRILVAASDWQSVAGALPVGQLDQWVVQPLGRPVWWDEATWRRVLARRSIDQQDQLAMQLFITRHGDVAGRMAWRATLKRGVVIGVEPLDVPAIWQAIETVEKALRSLGARGPVNIQGIWDGRNARFFEINPRFSGSTGVRALLGYREVEAAVRHFGLHESAQSIRNLLSPSTDRIGVRQMAEHAVPVAWVNRFESSGRLTHPVPLERVLLTGASGYLGRQIIRSLLQADPALRIVAPVRNPEEMMQVFVDHPQRDRLHVLAWEDLECFSPQACADVLIHAAAVRPPTHDDESSLLVENLRLTRIAVEAASHLAIPFLMFISSHAVYEGKTPPWHETTPPYPLTPYAYAKVAGEMLVRGLVCEGTRYAILRMASLHGLAERIQWERVAHRFARQAALGETIHVHGDGSQRIDLLHIRDAACAVTSLLKAPVQAWNQTYNISSGNPIGIMKLAELCGRIAVSGKGLDVPILLSGKPARAISYGASNRKARDVLGWSPAVSLRNGLQEVMKSVWEGSVVAPDEDPTVQARSVE